MKRYRSCSLMLLALLILVSGCASWPAFEAPHATVVGVKLVSTGDNIPSFEVALRIGNPNEFPLKIKGMTYTLYVDEKALVRGLANNLPEVAAYGEVSVTIMARPDLLQGARLLGSILANPRSRVAYRLEAKIDPAGWMPAQRINEEGFIALNP